MNTHLTPTAEAKLTALGNKRYYRTLALTVAWLIFVTAAFVVCVTLGKSSLAEPHSYLILVLWVLPFFPFGAHKILLSKTFYATVSYGVNANQFESLKYQSGWNVPQKVSVLEITFKRDDGKEITITYKKSTYPGKGFHYAEGDRVLFVRGLRFPCKLPCAEAEKFTCPLCGTTIEAETMVCRSCRTDLSGLD